MVERNNNICGLLILFDIIDSTKRKEEFRNDWLAHTQGLYDLVGSFSTDVGSLFGKRPRRKEVCKYIGDSVLLFFPTFENQITSAILKSVLDKIERFRAEVRDTEELSKMGLKAVTTVCNDVVLFQTTDILGIEIDMSFRLEAFAGASHILVNERFKEILGTGNDGYKLVPCQRNLKGIGERTFFALTNIQLLEQTIPYLVAHSKESGVMLELFQCYIQSMTATANLAVAGEEAEGGDHEWGK